MMISWLQAVKHGIAVDAATSPAADDITRPVTDAGVLHGRPPPAVSAAARVAMTEEVPFGGSWFGISEPVAPDDRWRGLNLDASTLSTLAPYRIIELLADLSPDISRAMWDFLRMCNPGWTVTTKPTSAKSQVDAFIMALKELYGSMDVIINRLYIGGFLRGAFFGEVVLDERGRLPIDMATPDPRSARFKRVKDKDRGNIWQLGQLQNGEWVPLDYPTVRYIPIDPLPDSPYGRPLASPALFTSIFLIGLLHDLRRVVAQQGYPRLDVEILLDELVKGLDDQVIHDPVAFRDFVTDAITEVQTVYSGLQPDDAYIHTSAVKVNRPVGAVDSSSLGSVSGLVSSLERQVIRALKTMPLLMGVNEATSETHANRQWEIYVAGVKALQHLAESLLEHLITQALTAQGITATITFRFAELRASEQLRDAQTEQMKIGNAREKYFMGWISHHDAAQEITGHKADTTDGPRFIPTSETDPNKVKAPAAPAVPAVTSVADGTEPTKTKAQSNGHVLMSTS